MDSQTLPGAPKAELQEMPQVKDRYTFIYLEKCKLSREDSAIKAEWKNGYVLIPSCSLLVLLLGPGTSMTHRAAELIGDSGVSMVWVGEGLAKLYGFGRPLTHSSALLVQQALCVSRPRLHMEVVKRMYALRFPDEDLTDLTLQQLRGKEGSRVRKEYQRQSRIWNVPWNGRNYDPENFYGSDAVNMALSTANTCLYGLTGAVLSAMGLSPGLGFIHVNHERSFIYDVADLYKAEFTIPLAFEIASKVKENIPSVTRKTFRDRIYASHLVERMVSDLKYLLNLESDEIDFDNTLVIWDGLREFQKAGVQYQPKGEGDTQ